MNSKGQTVQRHTWRHPPTLAEMLRMMLLLCAFIIMLLLGGAIMMCTLVSL